MDAQEHRTEQYQGVRGSTGLATAVPSKGNDSGPFNPIGQAPRKEEDIPKDCPALLSVTASNKFDAGQGEGNVMD